MPTFEPGSEEWQSPILDRTIRIGLADATRYLYTTRAHVCQLFTELIKMFWSYLIQEHTIFASTVLHFPIPYLDWIELSRVINNSALKLSAFKFRVTLFLWLHLFWECSVSLNSIINIKGCLSMSLISSVAAQSSINFLDSTQLLGLQSCLLNSFPYYYSV